MKNNCDMARDLMPLTIDGVASEAGRQYVKEHLEECAECRAYLAGMKASLKVDADQAAREMRDFTRTAAHMKHRRWLRRALIALVALAVIFVGMFVAVHAHRAYNNEKIALTASEYTARLSQLEDGRVIVTAQTFDKYLADLFVHDMPDDGGRVGRITLMSTRGSSGLRSQLSVYVLSSVQGYNSIEYGDGESVTLWTRGETIAPASPEMEAYYAAYAALEAFDREVEKRHMIQQAESGEYRESYQRTPEEEDERYDLFTAVRDTRDKVPEWQNGGWGGRYW